MASEDDRTAVLHVDADGETDLDRTQVAGAEADGDQTVVAGAPEAGMDDLTMVRAPAQERPRLITRDAAGALRELPLTKPDALIGRGAGCDIVLTNPEVSRQHVRITLRGTERVLTNVGTRGNTYVNGQLVTADRVLKHGDVVTLASEELVYATLDDTPAIGAPTAASSSAAVAPATRSRAGTIGAGLGLAGLAAIGLYLVLQEPEDSMPPPFAPVPPAAAPVAAPPAPAVEEIAPAVPAPAAVAAPAAAPPDDAGARAEQVRKLLYRADVAYLEKRYLTPPDDSAVFLYGEALKIDPDNERARAQIAAIVEQYVLWAEEALDRRDRGRAQQMADKASYVVQQAATVAQVPDVRRRLETVRNTLAAR